MPEKENENKLMAMLERRGIVRKAGSEDEEQSELDSVSEKDSSQNETDVAASIGSTQSEAVRVTPAARQPVPGMATPILSGEQPQNTAREEPQHLGSVVIELKDPDLSQGENMETTSLQDAEDEITNVLLDDEINDDIKEPIFDDLDDIEYDLDEILDEDFSVTSIPLTFPGGFQTFSSDTAQNEEIDTMELSPPNEYQQQSTPDDHTNRFIDIEDLYELLALKSNRTETIYLVEEYLKSLPDSLPDESRRDIVTKIVAASGFDYDLLMGDGVLRVKMLKDYAERFASRTDEYVASRQAELDELDKQIQRIRGLIEDRRELHKRQFFAIEAEAQRLKEILEFLAG
ncbi:MAG: hypothetical protein FWG88_01475 [Oscillospiraceae bacterium]|nr:hypothetical protein [Oscillospiraceae bacterium]